MVIYLDPIQHILLPAIELRWTESQGRALTNRYLHMYHNISHISKHIFIITFYKYYICIFLEKLNPKLQ